jgi:large subunit ribosomal protein L25
MEEKIVLEATKREIKGKQVNAARREGKLPAVIYGRTLDQPISIFLDAHQTGLTLQRVGQTTLIDINIEGKTLPTLVREKQRDVIYGRLLHVDFLAVSMTETLRANVKIELVGASPAVKDFGAILVTGFEEVEIESLPGDLPEKLVLDVSSLKNIGDSLLVGDLPIPPRVILLTDPDEMVVLVTAPMAEEIEEIGVAEAAEPDIVEKGKVKEEEGEES